MDYLHVQADNPWYNYYLANDQQDVKRYQKGLDKLKVNKNNALYRTPTLHEQQYYMLVVPDIVKDSILQARNDDVGHQGRDRTSRLVMTWHD